MIDTATFEAAFLALGISIAVVLAVAAAIIIAVPARHRRLARAAGAAQRRPAERADAGHVEAGNRNVELTAAGPQQAALR